MASKTIKLMFDGELRDCLVHTDPAGEIVAYARDGRHVKFPAGCNLDAAVKAHNKVNGDKPMLAEEVEAQQSELAAFLNG